MAVNRPLVGASGLLIENDSVLLIKRGYPPSAGQWAVPGGKVEWGEPLEAAMVREFAEETGLRVASQGELAAFETVDRNETGDVVAHFIIHVFRCLRVETAGVAGDAPRAADDAVAVRLVSFADLAQYQITRTTLKALRIAGLAIDPLVDFAARKAQPEDAALVREILHRAFAVQRVRLTHTPGSLRESVAELAADIAAGAVWIGLFRGLPVATGRIRLRDGSGYVSRLGVDHEYQGLGLGRRLLRVLEERARALGLSRVTLKTSEMMTGNEEFYRSCGYAVVERAGNEQRHIFMAKELL
ncbi:MAG: GNAT family N-acetyltransferase [Chloroflexota bacterium]